MAATITWDGTNGAASDGVISAADSATGFTAVKITSGGAGPTAVVSGNPIEGTDSITCRSDNKRVYIYYDIGASNTLDFTGGGNAEGEMIYAWAQFLGAGDLLTQSAGGFGMFLESSTPSSSQYHLYYFYGSDNYTGGWKRMVLDPNETASASSGTAIDLTAVRYIGVFGNTNVTAKFDNLVLDQMMVGKGLIVTGTSTTDDLKGDLLADELSNRYGIWLPLNDAETAFELNGSLTLGDTTAATDSTLTDVDANIFLGRPQYYDGTSVTTSVPTTYFNINCVGGTGTNSITIGKVVGTNAGRNGWSITGNSSYTLNMDFDNGSVNTSKWYGCKFTDVTGTITWGTNTAHHSYSNSFTGCGQFDPGGGIVIRNNQFVGTADVDSALLWNENINIQKSNFIANTVGAAIEHPSAAGTPYAYTDLVFSGNTFDGLNSSGTDITVNLSGTSDASTDEGANTITYASGSVTLTVTVQDPDGNAIGSARTLVTAGTGGPFPGNVTVTITTVTTTASVAHTAHGLANGDKVLIKGANENELNGIQTISNVSANAYDYTITSIGGASGTGTIKSSFVIISGLTNGSGVISDTRSYASNQPLGTNSRVRKSSSSPYYKSAPIVGTVSSTTGADITVVMLSDE